MQYKPTPHSGDTELFFYNYEFLFSYYTTQDLFSGVSFGP